MAGSGDNLYVVTENGVYRTSASRFGKLEKLVAGDAAMFQDSAMSVDRKSVEESGTIFVIGQQGKTVRTVDYWMGKPTASEAQEKSK